MYLQTNKENTIEAFKVLIQRYRNPAGQVFGRYDNCPLCLLFDPHWGSNCKGCPLADEHGQQGCDSFASYPGNTPDNQLDEDDDGVIIDNENNRNVYKDRALFFEKYLPVIEGCPEAQFTKEGWMYFHFDKND